MTVSADKSVLKSSDESEGIRVKPPIMDAYLAPEPMQKFIEIGAGKKGQTVMIVEAMKTMNRVPSTADGTKNINRDLPTCRVWTNSCSF